MEEKTSLKQSRNVVLYIVFGFIIGLLLGLTMGCIITGWNNQRIQEEAFYQGYNLGSEEMKDKWINYQLGIDDCYYQVNENKTMQRYVCGNLAGMWREI